MIKQVTRKEALKRLHVFIGQWRLGLGTQSLPQRLAAGGSDLDLSYAGVKP